MRADTEAGLAVARYLAECGVPIFVARLTDNGGISGSWKDATADPSVVDSWREGWALCAVMGHVVDAIDVDPRNGGHIEELRVALGGELPVVYGKQCTPSGGEHYLVATMGVRKVGNVVPGVDIQAGVEGEGRGILFLAPTVRTNKLTGQEATYTWEVAPDLGPLLLDEDVSGAKLAELVKSKHSHYQQGKVDAEGYYTGPAYHELTDEEKAEADAVVEQHVQSWRDLLKQAVDWPEGQQDERGRGWEALARDLAWALAKMAACPWMAIDDTGAELLYHELLPEDIASNDRCAGKWLPDLVGRAAQEPVDVPPWVERMDAFGRVKPVCDVTSEAAAGRWLDDEMGVGPLAGLFRRKSDLIYTPRVGEDGYTDVDHVDDAGPAQVRRMVALQLAKRIDKSYRVVKAVGKGKKLAETVFPESVALRSMSLLDELPQLDVLRMITHTPVVRADGSVLDAPGYDKASGVLYLPEHGLHMEPVTLEPNVREVVRARELLLRMVQDFPFVTEHDRANYLACLFLPLLRLLVPPPYKMLIIGAPQRGSGKSLLAEVMRVLHGGVFRSEIPQEEDERRKVITAVLDSTSAPVVQFDNVSGVMKSSVIDGLLTSAVWSDRRLATNVNVELPNDRLWVVTGNNVHIGGDLERRVLWCTINAHMERPEERAEFAVPLPRFALDHRGELLRAMLTLVRAWVVAGMPCEPAPTTDSFGRQLQVLRGVLGHAGIGGVVGHVDSAPSHVDPEAEEVAEFFHAVVRVMGDAEWTVRELVDKVSEFADDEGMRTDELPGDIAAKLKNQPGQALKQLGRWLSYRTDRVVTGLVLTKSGGGNKALKWRVVAN